MAERPKVGDIIPEVGRVKITLEMEGKPVVVYEFPRVKSLSLESLPRYRSLYDSVELLRPIKWAGEELLGMDFAIRMHALVDEESGHALEQKILPPVTDHQASCDVTRGKPCSCA